MGGELKPGRGAPIPQGMSRFAAALAALAFVVAPGAAHAATLGNWDRAEQHAVAHAGLLPKLPGAGYAGARALTAAQLRGALAAVAERNGTNPVTVPDGRVTVAAFDRLLVRQLGLGDLARAVQAEAKRAGLRPPSRFGYEVVARQLDLRYNPPSGDDRLELYPSDPITRAEAAWSLARVLRFSSWDVDYARQVLDRFQLPAYSSKQRRALRVAVSKIGMPYIWGGESDTRSGTYGPQAHGGYDCSGFVWRVFKLSGNALGARIGGRTAAQMGGEIRKPERLRLDEVQPGDLLFFGAAAFNGKATETGVDHVGI